MVVLGTVPALRFPGAGPLVSGGTAPRDLRASHPPLTPCFVAETSLSFVSHSSFAARTCQELDFCPESRGKAPQRPCDQICMFPAPFRL